MKPRPQRDNLTRDVARRIRQALFDAMVQTDGNPDAPALTVERAQRPLAPAALAAAAPAGERARMQTLYERCLQHYRQMVRAEQADAGVDDVGAAVAHFVAANLRALHGIDVSPAMLLRLERQLSGVVRRSAEWDSAGARDRQLYFEKLAIVAVLIEQTAIQAPLQGAPAIANVRCAARGYLHELLGLDADHLVLDAGGLALRPAA
jgi:hypothetical protein